MGWLLLFAFSWWSILIRVVAIIHFIRRRPDTFWLWIILIHWLGAVVYIFAEVLPDAGLLRTSVRVFPRRRRIHELEAAVLDNPSAGNYEELADLYMEDGNFAKARTCYDHAISSRTDSPDPFYRRGVCEIELGDFAAAVADLERVVQNDPGYDFHRGKGLLAHAYANTGQPAKAEEFFRQVTVISTLVRDVLQLCNLARGAGQDDGSAPVGAENPRQETHHAGIPAPPRAPLVPQGRRPSDAAEDGLALAARC